MQRRLIALAAAGLLAGMTLWFACGGRRAEHPSRASDDTNTPAGPDDSHEPSVAPRVSSSSAPPSSPPASTARPAADAPLLNTEAGATPAQRAELWRPTEEGSRQDLHLLASLERELGQVPPEAHELIRRRRSGASPAELRAWLQQHGPKPLRARLILSRWLSQIEGDGGAAIEPAPLSGGKDGGVPKVLGTLRKKDAAP